MPPIVFALLCWVVWLLPSSFVDLLAFDRAALEQGQYWRLWSGHLPHFSGSHLLADSAVIVVTGLLLRQALKTLFLAGALLAMPLISAGFWWLIPELAQYRGSSAIGAMLWTLAGCMTAQTGQRDVPRRWLGWQFLLLALKIAQEALSLLPSPAALGEDVGLLWQAHLFGAAAGLLCWACARIWGTASGRAQHRAT